MQLAIRFLKKSQLSDLHHPITDIQANFGINRPIRYQITVKKKVFTHTDGRTDRRRVRQLVFFSQKKITNNINHIANAITVIFFNNINKHWKDWLSSDVIAMHDRVVVGSSSGCQY